MATTIDAAGIGQGKMTPDEAINKAFGVYHDKVDDASIEDKLPTAALPKAPDPMPFALGPLGK